MKRLYLSDTGKKLGGVCGGLGGYFEKDPTVIRLIFILLTLLSFGLAVVAYIAMWLVMPKKPKQ